MVSLGEKTPSWELNRWGREALRFSPFDGGVYTLRGGKWNLQYSGEKDSHRFTILDGAHFEYDIILNSEPETNRLYLAIEGWEGFDFFRQPDTFGPEMLRGSYAVYKKEMVVNSPAYHVGTGKICHIHRPKIIDARGRWVWGDVRIDRGVMELAIPEGWLGEAAYPVVVDPVIGSSTVGAYYTYKYIDNEYYEWYLEDKAADPGTQLDWYASDYAIEFNTTIILNKYKASVQLNGTYNTYVYLQSIPISQYSSYAYSYDILPMLYSDSGNKPKQLLTQNSTIGNPLANLASAGNFTPRWVKSSMSTHGAVAANTDVWFGYWGKNGTSRFDYGTPLFQADLGSMPIEDMQYYSSLYAMASEYDFYDIGIYGDMFSGAQSWYYDPNRYPGARYDLRASMYLDMPAAYARTMTQGVRFTDARKTAAAYKKTMAQTVRLSETWKRAAAYARTLAQGAKLADAGKIAAGFLRAASQAVKPGDAKKTTAAYKKTLAQTAKLADARKLAAAYKKTLAMDGRNTAALNHGSGYVRKHTATVQGAQTIGRVLGMCRKAAEQIKAVSPLGLWRGIFRFPKDMVRASTAEKRLAGFGRGAAAAAGAQDKGASRSLGAARRLLGGIGVGDGVGFSVGFLRRLFNMAGAKDASGHWGDYVRGLLVDAGSLAGAARWGDYHRAQEDTAGVEGAPLRSVGHFIKLATVGLVRDYILRRFLKSNEELVLKSMVCREIVLDSRIH
jgi:hypothetical protein